LEIQEARPFSRPVEDDTEHGFKQELRAVGPSATFAKKSETALKCPIQSPSRNLVVIVHWLETGSTAHAYCILKRHVLCHKGNL